MAIQLPRFLRWFHSSPPDPMGTYPEPRLKDLILFVTDRCNMRCDHCMFWRRIDDPGPEMSLEQLHTLARSVPPLRTAAMTGGEPFLRKDLPAIVETFFRDNQTHYVQVNTNGLLLDRMENLVQSDLAARYRRHLTFQVSVDGLEQTHERLRRAPGSFSKILRHLKRLVELSKKHAYFRVVVLTNVNKNNYHEIEELADLLWNRIGVEHAYDLVRGVSFSSWNIPGDIRQEDDPRECDLPPLDELDSIFERIQAINQREGRPFDQFLRQLGVQIGLYKGSPSPFHCLSAGRTAGVVYSDGSVAACGFTHPFARLEEWDYDLNRLWNSEAASERRKRIQCCRCTHTCFVLTSLQEWEEQTAKQSQTSLSAAHS
jgi:MoaA/NifB/PqqE/SkfB family radical SAM enzyme